MRTSRLFIDTPLSAHTSVALPREQAHYATRVLRLGEGDRVVAFNGQGGEFEATLTRVGKREATLQLGNFLDVERESPLAVRLILGLSRGERMDTAIQKAVELGVTAIQPVATEFSVAKLDGERMHKRLNHWRQIVVSACEQCGRNRLPEVAPLVTLGTLWAHIPSASLHLVAAPDASASLTELPAPARDSANQGVNILVGPEGGLSQSELGDALQVGFVAVRMGPRVMRTETAAMATLAAMQAIWGDWRSTPPANSGS